ncbi:hypothetical protein [Winogradskyella forsetii]|uniref:hypothetical protein n=1 Tax=Winogradskyella forsetii TaxID=2686077 RepID=UPI0015CA9C4B|nr:hypothetical protein [Winogradskyella forsetii]
MKKLYDINKWLIIITLLLYLTFYGGILAQVILGLVQIIMSIKIMTHFSKLSKIVKTSFIIYVTLTVSLIVVYGNIMHNGNGGLELMFLVIIVTLFLAIFHLYITYKIKIS